MYQTVHELARLCELHLVVLLDSAGQLPAHAELDGICASTHYMVRPLGVPQLVGSIEPHAVREFRIPDLAWLIHRQIFTQRIDVVQLEYTVLGQYAGRFRRIPSILFEHDVYFQSIARRLPFIARSLERIQARWEYLRALRWELRMLPELDRIQVCSRDNADYLLSFLPQLKARIDDGYRAGIDTSRYAYRPDGREPFTILFLGSFRHAPNLEALTWFVEQVLPLVLAEEPRARVMVVGSEPPKRSSFRPCRSGGTGRLRRRCARAPHALFHIRVPDPERVRGEGEAAGSVRGGDSGGVDAARRRRPGGSRWRHLRPGRSASRIRAARG